MSHKERRIMQYTEVVYYNDAGEEVARERMHDDSTYDVGSAEPLTEQEIEDYL